MVACSLSVCFVISDNDNVGRSRNSLMYCRSWRLCVLWCMRLMICRDKCQVLQMWCWLGRNYSGSVGPVDLTLFFFISLPVPHYPLHTGMSKPRSVVVICYFFLCETWWISLRCSTWILCLWFRKPLTGAKDSLCGLGGNVDLYAPGNPHKWWLALAPSFPPHPLFLLSHVVCVLIIVSFCVLLLFFFLYLSAPFSPVLFT